MNSHRISALLAAAAFVAAPASSAVARGGGDQNVVQRSGRCTDGSTWKLKVKPDDGRLETELEVDQNRAGATWHVTLRRNGTVAARATRTTRAPSGSFSFERRIAGAAGTKVSATATRGSATCRGSVTAA
jgi:hypothetical protein